MLDEIRRVVHHLLRSDEEVKTRKKVLIFSGVVLLLLLANRFLFANVMNFEVFYQRMILARLLFLNNISPYSPDIKSVLENYLESRSLNLTISANEFRDPIYQLFIYLPFSLISNPLWAAAFFQTFNFTLGIFLLEKIYQLFAWQPEQKSRILNICLFYLSYMGISFYSRPDLTLFQLGLFTLGLAYSFEDKPIAGGVLLGICTVKLSSIALPLLLVLFLFINKKQGNVFIWFLISVFFICMAGIIFDNGWILKLLKNAVLTPYHFPFSNFSLTLETYSIIRTANTFANLIPIGILIWVALEWFRTPKNHTIQLLWQTSFGICLNSIIFVREYLQPTIFFIFPILYIIFQWNIHSTGKMKWIIYGLFGLTTIILPIGGIIFQNQAGLLYESLGFNMFILILIVFMLYWVRLWIMQNPLEDTLIQN